MNAKALLDRLMKEAGGHDDSGSAPPAAGDATARNSLGGLVRDLGRQLSDRGTPGATAATGGGGLDLRKVLGSGALAMLMGSKRGRRLGGKALKLKVLAGAGGLAWRAWQNYQSRQGAQPGGPQAAQATAHADGASAGERERVDRLDGDAREQRSREILQAMVMAARSDGHLDQAERAELTAQIETLGADPELKQWMAQQLEAPLDARALAAQADSPQAAREIYLVSVAMVDEQNARERAWLDELAEALGLQAELARELERQVADAGA